MNHDQLITIANHLGYKSISTKGLCRGFSNMWIQAVCSNQLEAFNNRMNFLEQFADDPQLLKVLIDKLRGLVKQGIELTPKQRDLLDIPAFFEGIALYLNPEIGFEMFGNKSYLQHNEADISPFIQSQALEKTGGLHRAFRTVDQYNQASLASYLNTISQQLDKRPYVAIDLSANHHSVAVRVVGKNLFELIDTNYLNEAGQQFTSEELAKKLNASFWNSSWLDWLKGQQPLLIMETSIFTSKNATLYFDAPAQDRLLNLIPDKYESNVLIIAAKRDDVATLKRIDFKHVGPSQLNEALSLAIYPGNLEAVDYLLQIPKINVNASSNTTYPLFVALQIKNYPVVEKLLKHPTFDHKENYCQGISALHALAINKDNSVEAMNLAKTLINIGVDVNRKHDFGNSPLYEACKTGNVALASLFLDNGADLHALNVNNNSALHVAILSGNTQLVSLLINRGANYNQVSLNNETPLHLVCALGNRDMVNALQAMPAINCNICSKNGFTPLMLACQNNHSNLIPLLLNKTNLSMSDIQPASPFFQLIPKCDESVKVNFLKKGLQCYIDSPKSSDTNYLNRWGIGFSKDEKIAAAQALLDKLNGLNVDLQPYQKALCDGPLAALYKLYNVAKVKSSYNIMSQQLGEKNSNAFEEKAIQKTVSDHSAPIVQTALLKNQDQEEDEDNIFSISPTSP